MAVITVEVSDDVAADLAELGRRCTEVDKSRDGATTHGGLDVAGLLMMLAEDAAMIIRRPGSWEGAGMSQQLASHGYEV